MADTSQNPDNNSLNFVSLLANPTIRNSVRGVAVRWKPASSLSKVIRDFYMELPRSSHIPTDMELDLYLKTKGFDESTVSLALMLKNKVDISVTAHGSDSLIKSFVARCRHDMLRDVHRQFIEEQQEDEREALLNYVKRISELQSMNRKRFNIVNFTNMDIDKFIEDRVNAPKRLIKSRFNLINEFSKNKAYEKGWLVQVVCPTGRGKTLWLLNEAIHFAEMGLRVFWTTLGDMEDVGMFERVCGIVTQTPKEEVTSKIKELAHDPLVQKVMSNIDFIFTHSNELTSMDVVNGVLDGEADGRPYDVVIVDYDDNFKSDKYHQDDRDSGGLYLKGGNSYEDLVRLAQNGMGTDNPDFKLVFVAAQAKPQYWNTESMPLGSAACSSQKEMKSIMTITMNCNPNVNHVGTMSIVKHRFGDLGHTKYVRENYGVIRGIEKQEYDALVSRNAYRSDSAPIDVQVSTDILTAVA